ncbi:PF20097 family protein [Bremerella sp.]|uniref:PF20097 family protein n=1 Tax=Bremerella sp. TaxID=2795602 RepID=UPI00391BAA11
MSENPFESPIEATLAAEAPQTEDARTCPDCGKPMVRGLVRNTQINWDDHSRSWLRKFFFGYKNLTPIKFIQIGTHKIPGYYCRSCQLMILDLDPKKR